MNINRRFIFNIMADAVLLFGVSLLPTLLAALLCGETAVVRCVSMLSLGCMGAGFIVSTVAGSLDTQVRPRIWYMTTFFTWIILIFLTVPVFYFGMPGHSLIDALLESAADWTTTGIGVYDYESMSAPLLLCRSTCNWLGGAGIIMTILSLVPTRQFLGYGLVSTEFPGPSFLKSGMPFRKGYRKVVLLYIVFTLVQFVLLMLLGMPEFTSLLTALSNTGTAGLMHINNGIVTGLSAPVKAIITVFALLGSLNCSVFLLIMNRKFEEIKKNSEVIFHLCRIAGTALIVSGVIAVITPGRSILRLFGNVLMQVVSFASTSGYMITDCSNWPLICVVLILLQMFIGACSLSTGGGIKAARFIIAFKSISAVLFRYVHPSSVRSMTLNKKPLTNDQILRANLFIVLFMTSFLAGALLLSAGGMGVSDSLNYSLAMITNTGSFIGGQASPCIASGCSALSKAVMCILMIAGRLEIYPFIMIFMRSFWKNESKL